MMDTTRKQSAITSLGIHVLAVLLLVSLVSRKPSMLPLLTVHQQLLDPYVSKFQGGGQHAETPASKGRVPPPRVLKQFTMMPLNPAPKLAIAASMDLPDAIARDSKLPNYGDPNGLGAFLSGGPGGPAGIGNGPGTKLGPGGAGGKEEVFKPGHGVTMPVLLHKVEPEFSEEARKARTSGTVIVYAEIGTDGKPHNLRVMRGFGMGLDEKALDAVAQWRFHPGTKDGKPVNVSAQIEVAFHLL